MESLEWVRSRDRCLEILQNDSELVALAFYKNQTVELTRVQLLEEMKSPKIIDLQSE